MKKSKTARAARQNGKSKRPDLQMIPVLIKVPQAVLDAAMSRGLKKNWTRKYTLSAAVCRAFGFDLTEIEAPISRKPWTRPDKFADRTRRAR